MASQNETALAAARSESIETQLARWHRFAGSPAWLEIQALKVRGENSSWERSRYAHASSVQTAASLATIADGWACPAVYMIANPIQEAVTSRAAPGQWHDASKGEGTSDAEIAARSVLFIDIDARRPKGTSATREELSCTVTVAEQIYLELAGILEDPRRLAVGASGNGRAVFLALANLPVVEAGKRHHAILIALAAKYTGERVEIDRVVHDAKRLIPCWGTRKKKGAAGNTARPHRRTAFVCAEEIPRATMAELDLVLATLRDGLDGEVQKEIDRALGLKAASPTASVPTGNKSDGSPFERANVVPIGDVLGWLGLIESGSVKCPGCGLQDSGVAIVGNGLKCSHARCASKGIRNGFRTPVDTTAEAKGISPREAVVAMAERFGFPGFSPPAPRPESAKANASPPVPSPPKSIRRMTDALDAAKRMLVLGPQPNEMRTGFDELDEGLKRLGPKEFTMLAADSGVGKSTIATQIALHVGASGHGVVYMNLEMSEEMYGLRTGANFAKVATQKARAHELSTADFFQLSQAFAKLRGPGTNVCLGNRSDHRTIPAIKAFCAEAALMLASEGHPLKLIVIDHILEVLVNAKNDKDAEGKERTGLVKDLGETHNVHVLALVHVTREASKNGTMPTKNQLASSSWFDRVPDNILILHQKRKQSDGTFDKDTRAKLSCQKSRWGEPFMVELDYEKGFFYPWSLEGRRSDTQSASPAVPKATQVPEKVCPPPIPNYQDTGDEPIEGLLE